MGACRRCFVHYWCDTSGDSSLIGAVYGWWKPVGDVLFTIDVIPREIVHSLVLLWLVEACRRYLFTIGVIPREIFH